jgi:transcriptional regulator GlxA family with amidase domain
MDRRVRTVIALMKSDLRHERSQAEMAGGVNLSSSRFRHLFKSETGTSPKQYFKSLRLKAAKHLLESTFLNVKEIMSRVGMSDKSRFAREFKNAYGLSPTQYRAQCSILPVKAEEQIHQRANVSANK